MAWHLLALSLALVLTRATNGVFEARAGFPHEVSMATPTPVDNGTQERTKRAEVRRDGLQTGPTLNRLCYEFGMGYRDSDVASVAVVGSVLQCQDHCRNHPACRFFTAAVATGVLVPLMPIDVYSYIL